MNEEAIAYWGGGLSRQKQTNKRVWIQNFVKLVKLHLEGGSFSGCGVDSFGPRDSPCEVSIGFPKSVRARNFRLKRLPTFQQSTLRRCAANVVFEQV